MSKERHSGRVDSRFLAALPAVLLLDGAEHPCSALDLSRSGVLLIGDLPEPSQPDVEVRICTSGGDLEVRVLTRLAHVGHDAESGETKLGLQFLYLTEEQTKTVEAMVSRVMEGMAPAALETLPRSATHAEVQAALLKTPLAHRIALAMRGQSREREILRMDPTPPVLEALARNPGLTLPEAISLARLPQLLPSTLEIMAEDERWKRSEELHMMIACHPRVTFMTADRVTSAMSELTIQRLLQRPGLHAAVRDKLMRKLSRKHRG